MVDDAVHTNVTARTEDQRITTEFATADDFERWLDEHHSDSDGIWLRIAKRGSDATSITYDEAVDVALCFGWVDGQKQRGDDRYWLQRFTPRRTSSRWSKRNRDKVDSLAAAGRMREPGLAEVERAKQDGRWAAAYDGQATASVPEELARVLRDDPVLAAAFDALDRSARYSIIWRINDARRPETRRRRVEAFVAKLRDYGTAECGVPDEVRD